MSLSTRNTGFAGLAAGVAISVAVLAAMPVAGQSPPQQVTTDTPEFCIQLLDRVSELVRIADVPPPQEVTLLSSEGQRMCDQGQTRGGIMRLRRALMMMLHRDDQP
jgi:hypothetical protein